MKNKVIVILGASSGFYAATTKINGCTVENTNGIPREIIRNGIGRSGKAVLSGLSDSET